MIQNTDFDAGSQHSLADFVRYSEAFRIFVTGVPASIGLQGAVKQFRKMNNIHLQAQSTPYFGGWYGQGWKREVVRDDGTVLFTIRVQNNSIESFHFKLHVEPAALRLLG
ncbi:MAG: hypothetical protein COV91_01945 [Candidatus Taylorbacteria bacterium CG11_big_fil_rev_8_21_14_0_20_46_11]|uniref:Uncharacterized protein n=1 Tax=Candidatus Taylorbacteria bacterium CG11_big_fil_rev_8_21_14_0_20_46_11 TaxID=1975025 RepID=A0A2H0KC70_9BACT|nr:MAG: hypothetical protein COV91_01945 [Candidatus Taylorbacteria bacterium CG11_big_fil_rev_8_21_14_0_20_46_11]